MLTVDTFEDTPESLKIYEDYASEYSQDLFALMFNDFKQNGYFVEVGACDGHNSNTFILEKYFGWQGILLEPNKYAFQDLEKHCIEYNRDRSILVNVGAWEYWSKGHAFYCDGDAWGTGTVRKKFAEDPKKILVNLDSLDRILKKYKVPNTIDYVSIDAEHSEVKILKGFTKYNAKCMSIEVAAENEQSVNKIMKQRGYVRVLQPFNFIDWWFVKQDIHDNFIERMK